MVPLFLRRRRWQPIIVTLLLLLLGVPLAGQRRSWCRSDRHRRRRRTTRGLAIGSAFAQTRSTCRPRCNSCRGSGSSSSSSSGGGAGGGRSRRRRSAGTSRRRCCAPRRLDGWRCYVFNRRGRMRVIQPFQKRLNTALSRLSRSIDIPEKYSRDKRGTSTVDRRRPTKGGPALAFRTETRGRTPSTVTYLECFAIRTSCFQALNTRRCKKRRRSCSAKSINDRFRRRRFASMATTRSFCSPRFNRKRRIYEA